MTDSPFRERHIAAVAVVLGLGTALRLLLAAIVPLFPDEAYYWEWSRHLAAGYFDHPPGIPLLIRAGTLIGGLTPLAVRSVPIFVGLVAEIAAAAIAWRLADGRAAVRASIVISCLPLAAAGLVLATPDAPLLATTALTGFALVRAIQSPPGSHPSLTWWTVAGIAVGLSFCSKYTSILLPAGVVLAVVTRSSLRRRLREPGPYLACGVAVAVFFPVLIWNAEHHWISFGFQLKHGLAVPTRPDPFAPLKRIGDLLGGQAGLVSPIVFVLLALATARALRRSAADASFVLAVVATFSFLFFCASATRQRVEANWPAPAYIPAIALLVTTEWSPRERRWLRAGIWLAGILSAVIYVHAAFGVLPLAPPRDPLARAAGWRDLARSMATAQRTTQAATARHTWLGADRYQDASEIAFSDEKHPLTFSVNLSGRGNQYDLWPGFRDLASVGDNLVLALDEVGNGEHSTVRQLGPEFTSVARGELVALRSRHGTVTQRRLWILRGWRGDWPR